MSKEVEKKFVINYEADWGDLDFDKPDIEQLIEQFYLFDGGSGECRVRKYCDKERHELTIKSKEDKERVEYEVPLNSEQYENLLSLAIKSEIRKNRYIYLKDNYEICVDFYEGHSKLRNLLIVEIEVRGRADLSDWDEDKVEDFVLEKSNLDDVDVKDVTSNENFKNVNLADSDLDKSLLEW